MIRRAVLVAAAAVALTGAPGAAMAYAPPGASFTVADPTPAAGVPFTVHVVGAKAKEVVTLRITRKPPPTGKPGATLVTKTANARGVVDFAVALSDEGDYTLVSTSASGAVLGRQSVTVADQGAVIVAGEGASADGGASAGGGASAAGDGASAGGGASAGKPDAGATPGAGGPADGKAVSGNAPGAAAGGELSRTGLEVMDLAVGGGALVLAGAISMFFMRRRKSVNQT